MTHFKNAASVPDEYARLMTPAARKELGIVLPEEAKVKADDAAEAVLQGLCEDELNRTRVAYLHLSMKAREKKGWPDLTFVINGIPLAIELKSATGKLSPEQKDVRIMMVQNGWVYVVVRSFDLFKAIIYAARRRLTSDVVEFRKVVHQLLEK